MSPFSEYSQISTNNGLTLKIYIPSSSKSKKNPLIIEINPNSRVEEVIGFILFKYSQQYNQNLEPMKINKWSLRIIENINDEENAGNLKEIEPDLDFPVLNRKSTISTYSYTSYVLVKRKWTSFLPLDEILRKI